MTVELIFATNNEHKLKEIQSLVGENVRILSLEDAGISIDIPEDFDTLEENAHQKAQFIHEMTGKNCFADDTGLEVQALNGEPGVFSARYSRMGDLRFPDLDVQEGNIRKLLMKMRNIKDRRAQFRTVISIILDDNEFKFEGIVKGHILEKTKGNEGFGYDPVFQPEGYLQSFAEMTLLEKNRISHRARAMQHLVNFLGQVE
jgi:XTP/dITP diphosphohydrolase